MTLGDDLLLKVDLRVDSETPDDAGDRIPRHFDQSRRLRPGSLAGEIFNCHSSPLVRYGWRRCL